MYKEIRTIYNDAKGNYSGGREYLVIEKITFENMDIIVTYAAKWAGGCHDYRIVNTQVLEKK